MNKPLQHPQQAPVELEREPELLGDVAQRVVDHIEEGREHTILDLQTQHPLPTVTRMQSPDVQSQPETPFQMVIRLSSDPNFSIEKLDRLVAMIREQENDKQREEFNNALSACQQEIQPVARNAENKQTKSYYATLDKIADAVMPLITGRGFSVTYGVGANPPEGHYKITAILARGGFERHYEADVPVDISGIAGTVNKTRTHAFKSTTTYGRSILLCLMFNITTKGDDDGNAAGGKVASSDLITPQQVETLQRRLVSLGVDIPKFYKNFGIEQLEELGQPQFQRAMSLLDQREKAAANKPSGSPRDQVRQQLKDSVAGAAR